MATYRNYEFIEWLKQIWCFFTTGHEPESNGIDDGTFCEVHSWCKNCGANL